MKAKQTSPIPTTIDEQESIRTDGIDESHSKTPFDFPLFIR